PVERRADRAVLEAQARVLERGLARLGRRLRGLGVGADLRVRLLRDEILVEQLLVALRLRARLVARRAVAQRIRLGLAQRGLEWARVDPEKDLAFLHRLAFAEVHLEDLPADARFHGDGRVG